MERVEILSKFLAEIRENSEKLSGVVVAISAKNTDSTVDSRVINDELTRSGFTRNLCIDTVSPSTIFTDYVNEIARPTNNLSGDSDFSYAVKRLDYDTTDKDNVRAGLGRILYSVVRVQKSTTRTAVDSSMTGEIAQIQLTFRKRGKNSIVEENPEMKITLGDMGSDAELSYFENFVPEFYRRVKDNYTVGQIVSKVTEAIKEKFKGIHLRERGGMYFLTKSNAESFVNYISTICLVVKDITPILVPMYNIEGMESSRYIVAESLSQNLLVQYQKEIETWTNDIQAIEEGERDNFHSAKVSQAILSIELFKRRTAELRETLDFDFARVEAMEEELAELLNLAGQRTASSGYRSPNIEKN